MNVAPTFAHCVWLSAPRGGPRRLGAAQRRLTQAPTLPHCVWVALGGNAPYASSFTLARRRLDRYFRYAL